MANRGKAALRLGEGALTHARVLDLISYDPLTGDFTRQKSGGFKARAGSPAGAAMSKGGEPSYRRIMVDGVLVYAHRLAVFYMTGEWPKAFVDHRNGDKRDNRWDNLREASAAENVHNRPVRRDARTGIKNVRLTREGSYEVRFWRGKRQVYSRRFASISDAAAVAGQVSQAMHAEFSPYAVEVA